MASYTDSIRGAKFRGSRFPGFTGGGTSADGNFSPAGSTLSSAPAANGNSTSPLSSPLANPESALANIYAGAPRPESALSAIDYGDVAGSAATSAGAGTATYAAQKIGAGAGSALQDGASFGDALGHGAENLGSSVSSGAQSVGKYLGFGGEAAGSSAGSVSGSGAGAGLDGIAAGGEGGFYPVTPGADSAMYGEGAVSSAGEIGSASAAEGAPSFFSGSNLGQGGATAAITTAINIAQGEKPLPALDSGIGSGVGAMAGSFGGAIGSAIGATIGSFVGSKVGSVLPGRVICTELVRQGKMDQGLLDIDIAFSAANIGDTTRAGYWLWAMPVVRWMRRDDWLGRLSTAIARPLSLWRAAQIAYQVGARRRPHIRGILVRLIGESACWVVGAGAIAASKICSRLNPGIKKSASS